MFRRVDSRDRRVCDAQIYGLLQDERRLRSTVKQTCTARGGSQCAAGKSQLYALRVQIKGERAKCAEAERLERKSQLYEARAARAASKTEIAAQKQQRRQAALELGAARAEQKQQRRQAALEYKMQRLEYRRARSEGAGEGGTSKTVLAGGALAAAAAAFLLL